VRIAEPDTGDGVLRNSVVPGTGGECRACAVTNAVEGTFTVQQSARPQSGSAVRPGDTIRYTVNVAGGESPAYASFTDSLSANVHYAGDARASAGAVSARANAVSWSGALAAGKTATVTFSATVRAGGENRITSTVQPVGNDPYLGSCGGACRVSYRVLAPVDSSTTGPEPTTAVVPGPGRSGNPVAVSAPTTSLPHIADTGARTAGLSELAVLLLLCGSGLLLLGLAPRRRARHRR
jgi:uncharacterized repeat protein (TIGR01451 family)